MTYDIDQDIIDRVTGLAPGSVTHTLRHQCAKVVEATQGSYDALFSPTLDGLTLIERLLVALYASRFGTLTGACCLLSRRTGRA